MRRADNQFARRRPHLDMHDPPVAIEKGDLINEIVSYMTEFRRQRLGFALRGGEFERREWLDQAAGLDLFARLGGVEADRLRRGGVRRLHLDGVGRGVRHDGARGRDAANHGERGHDDEGLCCQNAADHVRIAG